MPQADPPCLLTYTFYPTWPQPVQISTPNGAADAAINVSVSNPRKAHCNRIELYIPVGSAPDALTPDAPTVAPSTSRWSVGKSLMRGNELGLGEGQFTRYTCDCNSPADYGVGYPLAFSVSVSPVSSTAGDYTVWVSESSGQEDDPAKFVRRSSSFTLQKAQPQFYLHNFIASSPSTDKDQRVPVGDFKKGDKIQLSWEGNGSTYTLYTAGGAKPLYSGPDTSFTLEGGLEDTRTFILQAEVTGADGGGGTGFETVSLYQSLTVKIVNPVITASSIYVEELIAAPNINAERLVTASLHVLGDKVDEPETVLFGGLRVVKDVKLQETLTITSQKGSPLQVTGLIDDASGGIEFRHSNKSQGIGFTHNTIYATGRDQDLIIRPSGTGRLIVKGTRQLVGSRKLWEGKVGYGRGWAALKIVDNIYGFGGPPIQPGASRRHRLYIISWSPWSEPESGTLVRLQVYGSMQDVRIPLSIYGNPGIKATYRGQEYSDFFAVDPSIDEGLITKISVNSITGKATPNAQIYELWVEFWDVFD